MNEQMLTVIHDETIDIEKFFQSLPNGTQEHSKSVAVIATQILKWADEKKLLENKSSLSFLQIQKAITYHDIGLVLVPERILYKIDDLTGAERRVIEKHAVYGGRLLERYRKENDFSPMDEEMWRLAAEVAVSHHERWDGRGYPFGQMATAIPQVARAVTIADTYDSIVRGSVYRMPLPKEYALLELVENAGTQFDPVLIKIVQEKEKLIQEINKQEGKVDVHD